MFAPCAVTAEDRQSAMEENMNSLFQQEINPPIACVTEQGEDSHTGWLDFDDMVASC